MRNLRQQGAEQDARAKHRCGRTSGLSMASTCVKRNRFSEARGGTPSQVLLDRPKTQLELELDEGKPRPVGDVEAMPAGITVTCSENDRELWIPGIRVFGLVLPQAAIWIVKRWFEDHMVHGREETHQKQLFDYEWMSAVCLGS